MRRPQRMWSAAICRKRCRSLTSSSSITLPPWRWVLRCWPTTRQAAAPKPGSVRARPQQPSADVPGSEVSRRTARSYCFSSRRLRLQPGVLLLQLSQPSGFLGLHPPYCCLQRWYVGCVTSMTRQTSATVLPWAISCYAVFSSRMIYSAVCMVRFMVESPAQSGRLRISFTLDRFSGSTSLPPFVGGDHMNAQLLGNPDHALPVRQDHPCGEVSSLLAERSPVGRSD